jgi:hypothetical protein
MLLCGGVETPLSLCYQVKPLHAEHRAQCHRHRPGEPVAAQVELDKLAEPGEALRKGALEVSNVFLRKLYYKFALSFV